MLNSLYLEEKTIRKIRAQLDFSDFKVSQLGDFFNSKSFFSLKEEFKSCKKTRQEDILLGCYSSVQLSRKLRTMLESMTFVSQLLGKKQTVSFKGYSFSWKDYWLMEKSSRCMIIDFSGGGKGCGGEVCFSDGEGSHTMIPARENSVAIMLSKDLFRYVSYVNHHAKGSHEFLLGEIE